MTQRRGQPSPQRRPRWHPPALGRPWPTPISPSTSSWWAHEPDPHRIAMPAALIVGAFGQDNPGDEALLAAAVYAVRAQDGWDPIAVAARPERSGVGRVGDRVVRTLTYAWVRVY